jgi:hypothetical protein
MSDKSVLCAHVGQGCNFFISESETILHYLTFTRDTLGSNPDPGLDV